MLNWRNIQRRLGVVADGIAGPITYGALLAKVGGRRPIADLGAALALHAGDYAIDATPERMAGFLGECAHESLAFTVARERSEEHTSELQSLMRISYAVFCLKKKKPTNQTDNIPHNKHSTPHT